MQVSLLRDIQSKFKLRGNAELEAVEKAIGPTESFSDPLGGPHSSWEDGSPLLSKATPQGRNSSFSSRMSLGDWFHWGSPHDKSNDLEDGQQAMRASRVLRQAMRVSRVLDLVQGLRSMTTGGGHAVQKALLTMHRRPLYRLGMFLVIALDFLSLWARISWSENDPPMTHWRPWLVNK